MSTDRTSTTRAEPPAGLLVATAGAAIAIVGLDLPWAGLGVAVEGAETMDGFGDVVSAGLANWMTLFGGAVAAVGAVLLPLRSRRR